MKSTYLLLAPLVLATPLVPTETKLDFAPEEGTVLTRHFEATLEMELASFQVLLDDEELTIPDVDWSIEWVESIEVEDELLEVEDGRPTEMVRTFGDLRQESTIDANGEEHELLSTSALQGRVLRFEWDDDAEYYTIESDDDEGDLDEETLEWLEEDMDLRAVLPEDAVETGDTWEIDAAVYLPLMWPGGLLGFLEEDEDELSPLSRELNEETIENLTGEGEATLEEIREESGVRVAVIKLELGIETEAEAVDDDLETEDGEEIPPLTHTVTIERQLEGEILWDLEHNHLYSADIQASVKKTHARSQTVHADGEHEVVEQETYEGRLEYVVTIDRE